MENLNQQELEKLLIDNLRIARENREYLIKIDRRQRWTRNFTVFYWSVLVALAVFGTYYAFPYLKEAREQVSTTWHQLGSFLSFTQSAN